MYFTKPVFTLKLLEKQNQKSEEVVFQIKRHATRTLDARSSSCCIKN